MVENPVERFVTGVLQKAGAQLETLAPRTYRTAIPPDLAKFFPGRRWLVFTFDEEYFDLHREEGVEFVARGYPLLDRLVEYARSRYRVAEVALVGQSLTSFGIGSGTLNVRAGSDDTSKVLLGFYYKFGFRSDDYEEEIQEIWVDPSLDILVAAPAETVGRRSVTQATAIEEDRLKSAWTLAENAVAARLGRLTAKHEEDANFRLVHELARLARIGTSQADLERVRNRFRLTVERDLVFAEVVHYPLQRWTVTYSSKSWDEHHDYVWDAVAARWQDPPACPLCGGAVATLEACDAGRHVVCPDCRSQCSSCGASHCTLHPTTPCNGCGQGHCDGCLELCASCSTHVCPTCRIACPECGDVTCGRCLTTCDVCGFAACPKHFATCHTSGARLCGEHAHRCSGCGKVTHPGLLHEAEAAAGRFCADCAAPCAEPHDTPLYVCVGDHVATQCAFPHAKPHVLCSEHRRTCALHGSDAVFCPAHVARCATCDADVCDQHRRRSERNGREYCLKHARFCAECRRWVGLDETTIARGGSVVCVDCARPCHDCGADGAPWPISQLKPCPICLECGLQGGDVEPRASVADLLRTYPKVAFCKDHLHRCHVCSRHVCGDHLGTCPSCGLAACDDDFVTTVAGERLCRTCIGFCATCPVGTYHAKPTLMPCATCGTPTCPSHTHACESCLARVCGDHVTTCRVCGGVTCQTCASDGVCPTCAGLVDVPRRFVASLPLPSWPQSWAVASGSSARPDGATRIHVLYYPEFDGFWGLVRSVIRPPALVIAVIEARDGKVRLVRHGSIDHAGLPIPAYSLAEYLRSRHKGEPS
jgi:hypothetical protein